MSKLCEDCSTYDDGEGIVQFCPLHEAAPALLEAAIEALEILEDVINRAMG